ncbi:hypothetical protein ACFQ2Y_17000 [Streptomyces malaysiensis subsp. malaysiensis]
MLSGTGAVILAASAVLVLVFALFLTWVVRLRRALQDARRATERERAVSARERANAAQERTLAAERGEEVKRLAAVRSELDEAARRERILRDSVQASFESVARNMHAMSMVQQQVLDGLEQHVEDARLMGEVMKADHAAAQMTRKAQTLLVMCGIWPARRETRPVSLFDCVRGAQSRIVEFGRVDVHGGQNLYAVAPAVEGLMHAVAELLENATVFSPPAPRSRSPSARSRRARSSRSTTRGSGCRRTCWRRPRASCGTVSTWPSWARCHGWDSPVWGAGRGSWASAWSCPRRRRTAVRGWWSSYRTGC